MQHSGMELLFPADEAHVNGDATEHATEHAESDPAKKKKKKKRKKSKAAVSGKAGRYGGRAVRGEIGR